MKSVVNALTNLSAVLRTELTLLCQMKPNFAAALTAADCAIAQHRRAQRMGPELPRVLVTVKGGVADYVCDDGVDVEIFDQDNHSDDPEGTTGVPFRFADLAVPIDVKVERDTAVYELTLVGFDGSTDETDHLIIQVKTVLGLPEFYNYLKKWDVMNTRVESVRVLDGPFFDIDFTLPGQENELMHYMSLTVAQSVMPVVLVAPLATTIIPDAVCEAMGSIMMEDIVGSYDTPDQVPEWTWVQDVACFSHIHNGQDGIWDFMINLSIDLTSAPETMVPMIVEARGKNLSYLLIHQGT